MAHGKRDLRLEAKWRDLVTRQSQSGLGIRAFCQREHVTESAYYAWRRELRLRGHEAGTPAFVPVVLPQTKAVEGDEHVVIELRGGRVLRLPPTLAMARVTELVQAVERAL
jgi:hypothetical protein